MRPTTPGMRRGTASTLTAATPPAGGGGGARRLLGDILVGEGLVTPAQLEEALRVQRTRVPHLRLGQILLEQEVITREGLGRALGQALATLGRRRRLGDLLGEAGLLTPDQLDQALRHQRRTGLRLGEVLLQLDLVPESRLRETLAAQCGVAFVEPEGIVVEPEAAALVGRKYARHHRVVPIARRGGCLTVLVADPANGDVARELEASTGCQVRVATTTQAGFQRALQQAYGEAG